MNRSIIAAHTTDDATAAAVDDDEDDDDEKEEDDVVAIVDVADASLLIDTLDFNATHCWMKQEKHTNRNGRG